MEDLVYDRICHQLRAVGDGLAWRVSGYDRRYVIALSSNAATGTMAGNSGLPRELGAAAAMRATGSFGLLHDLTNCLRIGDISEFRPDGSKLLYEIKSSPNAKTGPQRRRMEAAVEAVMTGGELPGRPGTRIVTPPGAVPHPCPQLRVRYHPSPCAGNSRWQHLRFACADRLLVPGASPDPPQRRA